MGAALERDDIDPEILQEFFSESRTELERLETILDDLMEDLEDRPLANKLFEKFGIGIDRMMGASKTLGFSEFGGLCELGKTLAYKSAQVENQGLREIVVAVLYDAAEILGTLLSAIEEDEAKTKDGHYLANISTGAFASRLRWLADKLKDIERSSVSYDSAGEEELDQADIDSLIAELGI